MAELGDAEYLRRCHHVTGRTVLRDTSVTYDVVVGDWIVWSRSAVFGQNEVRRPGGPAFVKLAREQETVMHQWAGVLVAANTHAVMP